MAYTIHSTHDALGFKLLSQYGVQPWVQCTTRKESRCEVNATIIPPGVVAWRPITNGYNRGHRISEDGMRHLVIQHQIK